MKKNLQILMLIAIFSIIGGILQAQVDPPCNPVTNVETSNILPYSAKVTAKTGLSDKRIITQGGDIKTGAYGIEASTIYFVHRYTTAELAPYDGGYLTKISFIPAATGAQYALVVFNDADSTEHGYSQGRSFLVRHISENLVPNQWNEITLSYKIEATKELWIGYRITSGAGALDKAGYDSGPQKAGKGNLIKIGDEGNWQELTSINSELTYNWCIKGTIEKNDIILEFGEHGFIQGTGEKCVPSKYQLGDTTFSHTFSELSRNTTYDYYIQKKCFEADTLIGPYSFTTPDYDFWCTESFEDYKEDSLIIVEAERVGNGNCWTTPNTLSSGGYDDIEVATVTTKQSFHGSKAAKFVPKNQMIFLLGEKTTGSYVVDFKIYLPKDSLIIFAILHDAKLVNTYTHIEEGCFIEIYGSTGGVNAVLIQRNEQTYFTFPHNQWGTFRFDINLNEDSIQMTVNNTVIKKWQFSDQSFLTDPGTKKLYGLDFFSDNDLGSFYVDAINMSLPHLGKDSLSIDNVQDLINFRTAVNTEGVYKGVSAVGGFVGKHFLITEDLDLSSVCGEDIGNWEPIGNSADRAFKGTLNGQGHIITNLYINAPTEDNQGLFGFINNGTVRDLNLENGFINGRNNVGGLCATLEGLAVIENVTNGMTVQGNQNVGGFVGLAVGCYMSDPDGPGYITGGTIWYVTNTGIITARDEENGSAGGIVGTADTLALIAAINSGLISSPNNVGGLIGYARSYYVGVNSAINTGMILSPGEYQAAIIGRHGPSSSMLCYYDKQIYTGVDDIGEGKLTYEMVGENLKDQLPVFLWEFKEDCYPSVSGTANSNVSKLAAAPFFLQTDGTNYETIDSVISNIRLDTNVTWHCSNTIITIRDTEAVVHHVSADTRCYLTASLAGNEKVYRLTNKRLALDTTTIDIRLCVNQLPYQHDGIDIYRDTTLIYESSLGYDSSVFINLTVYPLPDITILGDSTPCYGTDVTLTAQSSDPNDTYLWSTTERNNTIQLIALTVDTTISVIASNDHNGVVCVAHDTINIRLVPVPSNVHIVGDSTPCYGTNVTLTAQSSDANDTYLWSTTERRNTIQLLALTVDTTISVIASNNHNGVICVAHDTIDIKLRPIYSYYDTISVCAAQLPHTATYGNRTVQFSEAGPQTPIVLTAANGCDSIINVYMDVFVDTRVKDTVEICIYELPFTYYDSIFDVGTTTDDYEIPMHNATGCDTVYLLRLMVHPLPTATITQANTPVFINTTTQLIATTTARCLWSTGDTIETITVRPDILGVNSYYLYLTSEYGCVDTLLYDLFTEPCGVGYPATDFENNIYATHPYGRNCWMVENLYSTVYADGQAIPSVMEYASSVYPDTAHNVSIFGRLYDWYSATRTVPGQTPAPSLIQGVCPNGWRLPTYNEYLELTETLGYSLADLRSANHWLDNAGNNSSNFDMRPAGYYDATANQFMNLHGNTYFITTTTILSETPVFEAFSCGYNCPELLRYIGNKTNGYSVRCVKVIE